MVLPTSKGNCFMHVIAKAYADEPLERDVIEDRSKLVYLVNPSHPNAALLGEESGVGFPRSTVFKFDSALFESLTNAWVASDNRRLAELWESATPI